MSFRKVAQFKELSLEYVSPAGAGVLEFWTDMPGEAMALRLTASLPETAADWTPRTTTISLVDSGGMGPLVGTLYQPWVWPPSDGALQLRSGVIWLRPIGVYLDGTMDEFFSTLPIPVGV